MKKRTIGLIFYTFMQITFINNTSHASNSMETNAEIYIETSTKIKAEASAKVDTEAAVKTSTESPTEAKVESSLKANTNNSVEANIQNSTEANVEREETVSLYNFFLASQVGDVSMLERFIQQGADIHMLDSRGSNALMIAVLNEEIETAKVLIKNGIDLNHANNDNSTALWYAVSKNNSEIATYLLAKGADPNIANNKKVSPLMLTAIMGYYDMAKLLFQYEVNLEAKNIYGRTALMHAIQNKQEEMVDLLLKKGAEY